MDYGKVSWIHDLAIDRFGHASQVLLKEAEAEKNLADQKVRRTYAYNIRPVIFAYQRRPFVV
jgi:hypothetical protein